MTVGHVWPERCRTADLVVPECKECNNNLGSYFDADLGSMALAAGMGDQSITPDQFHRLLKNHARIHDLNGEIVRPLGGSSTKDRLGLTLGYEDSLPVSPEKGDDAQLVVTMELPHANKIIGGLLHSCVLRMYYQFGPLLILDPNMREVRERLTRAVKSKTSQARIACFRGLSEWCRIMAPSIPSSPDAFVLRRLSGEAVCLGCFIPFGLQRGGIALVPGPGAPGAEAFEAVRKGLRGNYLVDPTGMTSDMGVGTGYPNTQSSSIELFSRTPSSLSGLQRYEFGNPEHSFSIENLPRDASMPVQFTIRPLRSGQSRQAYATLQEAAWRKHGLVLPGWVSDLLID